MMTPQIADWIEGAKVASNRARRATDSRRRALIARRAANLWERAACHLLARKEADCLPDAAAVLRRAATEWLVAGNQAHAAEALAHAARLDASLGPPRLIYHADPRPWTAGMTTCGPLPDA
jgi:hypothetical protein